MEVHVAMVSSFHSTSDITQATAGARASAATAAIPHVTRRATTSRRNVIPDESSKRPTHVDADVGQRSDATDNASSSASSASSSPTPLSRAVGALVAKTRAELEPNYMDSYTGRLNETPRPAAYRKSVETSALKFAMEFLQDLLVPDN